MYLVENPGGLPKLVVKLSGLIDQQLEASSSLVNNRVVTTFTGLPATPVTRFELNVAGGPNGLFTVGNELCAPRTIDGTFNSHTGQVATVSSPAQVVGNCVPVNAAATSRRPRLSVHVTGVRRSPTIRIVARKATEGSANLSTLRVVLPGQISVRNVRRGITVTAGGKRLATRNWSLSRSRVLTVRGLPKFGRSIITATIRSSAIRAGRSLRSRALRGGTLPSMTFSSRIVDITNARYTFRTRVRPGR